MRSKRTRDIIKKIAEQENLTIKEVDDIVFSFFRFTSKKISEGTIDENGVHFYPSIRLFKFGLFKLKESKRRIYEKSALNRKRSLEDQSGSSDDKGV